MGLFGARRSHRADAVITGAGSGIGAAFAAELARRGGRVLCSDIDLGAAQATADALHTGGGTALAARCDVTDVDDVHRLAGTAQSFFGGAPTLVINNAGVGAGGAPIGETDLADWDWVLGINLWGPIHGCHVFAPILRDAGRPAGIINVASAAAFGAAPGMAAYNVSKAGTLSLSETLSAELAGTGVTVTVLCPTFVKTNIVEAGRISEGSTQLADNLMRWIGFSPSASPAPAWTPLTAAASTACRNPRPGSVGASNVSPRRCTPAPPVWSPASPPERNTMATATIDMDAMLAKIKDRQWALADIDWAAPGAERITDEQRPKLKAFMADLCWIENIGARGFAALAKKAPTPTIAEIYRYFHAEEQRHANAELALMKRWGMLDDGEMPEPNVNIRLAMDWLDRYADGMSLSILGTVIPMLEVALDGALLKFLLEEVDDPVCHQVFEKINNDESRHLVVDFAVLDMIGHAGARRLAIEFVGTVASPSLIIGALMYIPLLNRVVDEIAAMGLEPERLHQAMLRFRTLGERGKNTWRVPTYQVLKRHAAVVVNPRHPYHLVANTMVRLSDFYPRALLKPIPSWFKELTHEPAA